MVKRKMLLISAALLFWAHSVQAQAKDSVLRQQEYLSVFNRAVQYDDLGSAAYALTGYLQFGGNAAYRDTLAILYYRSSNLAGAYRLSGEINRENPANITALTLLADISGRAGNTKASLEWYEKLCAMAPTPYNHYQLATRQFMLERLGECKSTLTGIIADSAKAGLEKVSLEISAGRNENVPVLAAAYNMLGALAYRNKATEEAARNYALALKAYPEFVIARQNLEGLKTPASPAKPAARVKN